MGVLFCFHTTNKPQHSLLGGKPRFPFSGGLGLVVWSAPSSNYGFHTSLKKPNKTGKCTHLFELNQTDSLYYCLVFVLVLSKIEQLFSIVHLPSTVHTLSASGPGSEQRLEITLCMQHVLVCRVATFEQMVERKTKRKIKRDGG